MRAVVFRSHGSPEVLELTGEAERPRPGPGEAVVRVAATGLNQVDRVIRKGYPGLEVPLPHVLGADVAGIVEEVCAPCDPGLVGRRVLVYPVGSCGGCELCRRGMASLCERWQYLGMHRQGGYAELVAVPARDLVMLPDSIGFAEAAALPVAGLTALHALTTVSRLERGQTFFTWGGAGAVGTMAIQIAKQLGARVIATASSPERLELMAGLGADVVLDRRRDDVAQRVRGEAPSGVDVALDFVGPETFPTTFGLVRKGGQILLCGILTGVSAELSLHQTYLRHLSIKGLYLGTREELQKLVRWTAEGRVRPYVSRRAGLDEIPELHRALEAGRTVGKVVFEP